MSTEAVPISQDAKHRRRPEALGSSEVYESARRELPHSTSVRRGKAGVEPEERQEHGKEREEHMYISLGAVLAIILVIVLLVWIF